MAQAPEAENECSWFSPLLLPLRKFPIPLKSFLLLVTVVGILMMMSSPNIFDPDATEAEKALSVTLTAAGGCMFLGGWIGLNATIGKWYLTMKEYQELAEETSNDELKQAVAFRVKGFDGDDGIHCLIGCCLLLGALLALLASCYSWGFAIISIATTAIGGGACIFVIWNQGAPPCLTADDDSRLQALLNTDPVTPVNAIRLEPLNENVEEEGSVSSGVLACEHDERSFENEMPPDQADDEEDEMVALWRKLREEPERGNPHDPESESDDDQKVNGPGEYAKHDRREDSDHRISRLLAIPTESTYPNSVTNAQ